MERDASETAAIQVTGFQKNYGSYAAVKGISFSVSRGEIFGLVGPNGAGKTTAIECLEGLRHPDGGTIRVLGLDPWESRRKLHARIGVQLQESAIAQQIKVREALDLYRSFYARTLDPDILMEQLGLQPLRDTRFQHLSGGQKQRLFTALALIHDPELLLLDELTTGLDPQGRRMIWERIQDLNRQGKTIVLTTHSMEEAERLCDRVLIVDHGNVVALDTPVALVSSLGVERRLAFTLPEGAKAPVLATVGTVERVEQIDSRVVVYGRGERFASTVVSALEDAHIDFLDLHTEQPNLEDVFLTLTGREMRD